MTVSIGEKRGRKDVARRPKAAAQSPAAQSPQTAVSHAHDCLARSNGQSELNPLLRGRYQNAASGDLQVQDGAWGLPGLVICTSNLLGKMANAIDAQFDDGKPGIGQVRGTSNATQPNVAPTTDSAYIDDGATVYTVCKTL